MRAQATGARGWGVLAMALGLAGCAPALVPGATACTQDQGALRCEHRTTTVSGRQVHWQGPAAPGNGPPPVVLLFQGSGASAERTWWAREGDAFGAWHQAQLVRALLEAGAVVVTPETHLDGATFWDTNVPPFSLAWETSSDHALMLALFEAFAQGQLGASANSPLYAAGISSGGYMTSRMALSYPGRFRALAIAAASWATCGGVACVLPDALPDDHPPTLFLHGEQDLVVPVHTMRPYADRLRAMGRDARVVTQPAVGHAWLPESPSEVAAWFVAH